MGPAKSAWTLDQGWVGQCHGWTGASGSEAWFLWHSEHDLTSWTMSLSMPYHQTRVRAILFIRVAPGCAEWSSCNTWDWPTVEMTTRLPHKRQSSWQVSSNLFCQNGWSWSSSSLAGHPCRTKCSTWERTGSRRVHTLMSVDVTGPFCISSISRMVSAGCGVAVTAVGRGRRLRASAFTCSEPFLCTMVYSYMARVRAHRWILPEAWAGTARDSLNRSDWVGVGDPSQVWTHGRKGSSGSALLRTRTPAPPFQLVSSSSLPLSMSWRHIQWDALSHLDNDVKVQPPVHKEKHHTPVPVHVEDHSVPAVVMPMRKLEENCYSHP